MAALREPEEPPLLGDLNDPTDCGPISSWGAEGRCLSLQVDPAIFYPEGRGVSVAVPKMICRSCPVRICCATDAILRGDENGIWGGLSGRQRRRARKLWLAGMPLVDAIARFDDPAERDFRV